MRTLGSALKATYFEGTTRHAFRSKPNACTGSQTSRNHPLKHLATVPSEGRDPTAIGDPPKPPAMTPSTNGETVVPLRSASRQCVSALLFTPSFLPIMLPSEEEHTSDHNRGESAEAVGHNEV